MDNCISLLSQLFFHLGKYFDCLLPDIIVWIHILRRNSAVWVVGRIKCIFWFRLLLTSIISSASTSSKATLSSAPNIEWRLHLIPNVLGKLVLNIIVMLRLKLNFSMDLLNTILFVLSLKFKWLFDAIILARATILIRFWWDWLFLLMRTLPILLWFTSSLVSILLTFFTIIFIPIFTHQKIKYAL